MDAYEDIDFNNPNSPKIQERILEIKSLYCHKGNISMPGWCPEVWDGILCWPSTAPGELSIQPCPRYIAGFNQQANASKQCVTDGQWFWNNETNSAWSNYSQCYRHPLVTVLMDVQGVQADNVNLIKKFLPILKTISKLGYTVSFFTLVVAFCILAAIKKLRCPRNMLHMHLFASFMMRAFMALLKDILFVAGFGLASEVIIKNGKTYWLGDEMESNWLCKAFTSFWQYFILANYFWILMEGLYLHNLVFFALFTDVNSSIAGYVGLGWGLPAIFVLSWVVTRSIIEDTYCWTTNQNHLLFLLIRVPTILSILINFVLFVNIVRVLLLKLKSTVSEETQRYKRWAKSTLVLVPLFGVHYTVFLGMSYSIGVNETVEIVWLFCDQLFASFQGFFVAVLYCFLNGEQHLQLQRLEAWQRIEQAEMVEETVAVLLPRQGDSPFYSLDDIGTRGGSLASSRGYLEIAGNGQAALPANQGQHPHHASPLCSKYTDQSLLSFCSNMSELSPCTGGNVEKIRDQHRWSDSECCHLTYELHNLQRHAQP
ncbi:hypothetical protein KM043_012915 [Ampulex compressa]|nr:hypothetical protein KM043_012915 [Ampulex compressa]